jgi:uncharacterized protein YodC (DUF2158 family)
MVEGDVVVLKSGGPKMTVTSTRDAASVGSVFCRWFDDAGTNHGQKFKMSALVKVVAEPSYSDSDS